MASLKGIRVLEMAQIMAGPTCGLLLADLGAEVIKIEKTSGGDDTSNFLPPDVNGVSAAYLMMNRNNKDRVVITGMGIISCAGNTVNKFWDSLLNGKSGIDYLTQLNTDAYSCKIGGEIKNFDPLNYMDKKESKRLAKNSQFAIAASIEAISNAELDLNNFERSNIGVLMGSGSGGTIPETEKEAMMTLDFIKSL